MTGSDFLLWVRGPMFDVALAIFVAGVLIRLLEIGLLGRKTDLAAARADGVSHGLKTLLTRFGTDAATFKRSLFTIVAGYVFHIGLFVVIFLFAPHIMLLKATLGVSWPGLPNALVDAVAIFSMLALLALLIHRLTHPLLRFLSTPQDYLSWGLTFAPFLTGYLAFHHLLLPYPLMLGLHIFSVEILMVLFPFTKLMHALSGFLARYYTGYSAGRKGVQL